MKIPGTQQLNTLWRAVNAASEIREMARTRRTLVFNTFGPITFFLRAENVDVRIVRWQIPRVEVSMKLEASFGWRIAAEQDESGVYIVAHRRKVLGGFSSAQFQVIVPQDTYLSLKLQKGRVMMEQINGTLQVPPPTAEAIYRLLPSGE